MTLIISVGKWGGFYLDEKRLCLGWIAFTILSGDFDELMEDFLSYNNQLLINELKRKSELE